MPTIYGINPIKEFLKADPGSFEKIFVSRSRRGKEIEEINRLAEEAGVEMAVVEGRQLEKMVGHVVHQGVVGLLREFKYSSLDDIVANRRAEMAGDLVVLADEIVDPHNLGAIIRTAYLMGANGIVVPARRASTVTATVFKTSAGAVRYLPIARETNLAHVIEVLKKKGYWIYAAEAGAEKTLEEMEFKGSVALVVGSEGRGVRRLLREKADFLFSIPMIGRINSLNVSVATGIVTYKIFSSLRRRVG
ncbi:MAG: 23S rRNA (guanosine(2251)-2'-O)-methyltransferase RlmB [Syntrophales bacterium]|nr:23S rRNA (guanosine(2251)-2'-O)-methyltransferase RlmB [Syntrophales bacterium]